LELIIGAVCEQVLHPGPRLADAIQNGLEVTNEAGQLVWSGDLTVWGALRHQDISPDNIILCDDSCAEAKIIDFGLARTIAGSDVQGHIDFAGKYFWMLPEQMPGAPVPADIRSDLYSLGLVIAAASRGRKLEMGNDLESAREARLTTPSLDGVPAHCAALLRRLLAPDPRQRLSSAMEVAHWDWGMQEKLSFSRWLLSWRKAR
jgi:serine/threonine protein kinase